MPEKYTYLMVNLASIFFPLAFSFHARNQFYKKWPLVWPAILVPAALFILWDVWFTSMGVWGFNPRYLVGVYFFNLPIEEVLFFICIPYACAFTYESVNILSGRDRLSARATQIITDVLCVFLIATALLNITKWYTASAFLVCAALLLLHRWVWKTEYLGRFYFAFVFILIPFFIVNGILTGTGLEEEVVWYNAAEFMGFRMGTIPFEDTFYGMALLLLNVTLYEFGLRATKRGWAKG
ncbi:MAG: lycopene cyclase domain-containing protein [Cyclobacteriaceae bacterium]|jgi:lycopene cyclase domain-containing protein|nr:lycopene cyclase domain-containing protein [Cyclobacteriaceae bacterium]